MNIDNYDENRHFFLGHYFRDNYESWMKQLPYVSSGVKIGRIEVWVTNKRGNYDQARNIIAFMDLAETKVIDNNHWISSSSTGEPKNGANTLYGEVTALGNIRDIQQTNSVLSTQYSADGITGGEDYEKDTFRLTEPLKE